uniref:Uncharacterized protein n=1 Tax=Grammatophora oceanica TaxID=210454 RepID=A0A7S1V1X5_9STRA|mmetsp:Transcript_31918/g.47448  ORF Transcript_31918/g.47448 Transcript_31918/m.47448 type:complete len:184 (+) Transcript_31918:95-646(+)
MGAALSNYTSYLANTLCGGSSRKLIAGWWYSILAMTFVLVLMSFLVVSTRGIAEGFAAVWSALLLFLLSVGGTMIMRKFHSSLAVGFFMGSVLAMSQLFFMLFLIYIGYGRDHAMTEETSGSKEEALMAFFAICVSILLGSFAAILGAHRSEILDKTAIGDQHSIDTTSEQSQSQYDPPSART